MSEARLIEAEFYMDGYMVKGLTWNGHEFLDASRNDTVWSKTKQFVADKGGNIPFQLLTEVLKKISIKHFGLE